MTGVCVITGGSRGIGEACVHRAIEAGQQVCFSYVSNDEAAKKVVSEVEVKGGVAKAVKSDVASEADVLNLFETADAMGTVTGLINNAGIVAMTDRVENYRFERLERMYGVNVIGSILCAREAVKRMSTKNGGDGGSIVNLSSAAAYLGSPNQYVDYAASKAAIDTFTKGLALEVADEGIRVNAVRPGLIDTELHESGGEIDRVKRLEHMVPMKRGGSADEIAKAVLWLMSDGASYVTGDSLNVTGGR
ncbi:MAG: SDR family oxidoreductase [Rhizobiaceae bacterium]|nr:SDR family oxidoreductase [Rhizobiaceae bacterium]